MWPRIINTLLGLWLMFAPHLLGYSQSAANNAYVCGAVIITFAVIAMAESVREVRWVNMLTGLWLVCTFFFSDLSEGSAMFNNVLTGTAVLFLSLVKGKIKESIGGGWAELFGKENFGNKA